MLPSGRMPPATSAPYPLTGIITRSGTEYELWCADDGGYWWITYDHEYGPFGLGEPDNMRAEDLAFAAPLP